MARLCAGKRVAGNGQAIARSRAHRVSRQLRAGLVWINGWDACDITVPFGGAKQSGFGRDRSLHALEKYTELKGISITYS